nr:hypothetical protein [Eubacterium sp.]
IRFFALVMLATCVLFGCKKEVKLNDYKLDDVSLEQTLFVCKDHYKYYWVFNKEGQCKRIEQSRIKKMDMKLLEALDIYMQDHEFPYNGGQINIDQNALEYCMNLTEVELKFDKKARRDCVYSTEPVMDIYYFVCGTGDGRTLMKIQIDGDNAVSEWSEDETVQRLCGEIQSFLNLR